MYTHIIRVVIHLYPRLITTFVPEEIYNICIYKFNLQQ